MNYWVLIDIVLLAIFAGCVYLVARSGLVKTLAFCLACIMAAAGSGFLARHTWKWGADKIFAPLTSKLIVAVLGNPEDGELYPYLDTAVNTVETAYDKIKEKLFNKNGDVEKSKQDNIQIAENKEIQEEEKASSEKISSLAGKYLSITIMFWLFFSLILSLLRVGIDELSFINRIPVVGFVNQILGVAAGIAIGYFVLVAPIYIIEKLIGSLDIADAGGLTSSMVINYIMRTLG